MRVGTTFSRRSAILRGLLSTGDEAVSIGRNPTGGETALQISLGVASSSPDQSFIEGLERSRRTNPEVGLTGQDASPRPHPDRSPVRKPGIGFRVARPRGRGVDADTDEPSPRREPITKLRRAGPNERCARSAGRRPRSRARRAGGRASFRRFRFRRRGLRFSTRSPRARSRRSSGESGPR